MYCDTLLDELSIFVCFLPECDGTVESEILMEESAG